LSTLLSWFEFFQGKWLLNLPSQSTYTYFDSRIPSIKGEINRKTKNYKKIKLNRELYLPSLLLLLLLLPLPHFPQYLE